MKRVVAIAALGASLLMVKSVSASVDIEPFNAPFTLDAAYASWGDAALTTFTSNPGDWEVQSTHYGSGYEYLGGTFNGTGNDTVQVTVTVDAGVAGVVVDLNDTSNNGEQFAFYGLVPGGGINGGNQYILTAPLAPSATNYFDGTGVLNVAAVSQMNIGIDPGSSTAPYDVHFNDISLISSAVPEPTGMALGAISCALAARRRRR